MIFNFNPLYLSDGYKVGHKRMLAKNTTRLYGTWIPRSLKHAPKGITKVVSFGQQLVWKWLAAQFTIHFFNKDWSELKSFVSDMTLYLGLEYDGDHFKKLHDLQYLPIKVKALPEGIETKPNIPHMTFINTVDGFGWLTLYLETIISASAWKLMTSATIALMYRRTVEKWVNLTDKANKALIPWLCHDFSARGLSPWDMITSGLGHATSFLGSDTLPVIPVSREFYGVGESEMPIGSVNASEHSVSTTKIFTVGEKQMIIDWLVEFPTGILSIVADTFDLWKLLIEYIGDPEVKKLIMARDGKLVIRPDSGDPVDIICGTDSKRIVSSTLNLNKLAPRKGVIELLWDIFGGTINDEKYKVLDPHIGVIYGDSITLDRQKQIYQRLRDKGFACTNIVLGIGSFTYQMNTRDTLGLAAKASWFEVKLPSETNSYNIYKDPITDDGTKKSLKGFQQVYLDENREIQVRSEVTEAESENSLLQTIFENGKFYNPVTLTAIRSHVDKLALIN